MDRGGRDRNRQTTSGVDHAATRRGDVSRTECRGSRDRTGSTEELRSTLSASIAELLIASTTSLVSGRGFCFAQKVSSHASMAAMARSFRKLYQARSIVRLEARARRKSAVSAALAFLSHSGEGS